LRLVNAGYLSRKQVSKALTSRIGASQLLKERHLGTHLKFPDEKQFLQVIKPNLYERTFKVAMNSKSSDYDLKTMKQLEKKRREYLDEYEENTSMRDPDDDDDQDDNNPPDPSVMKKPSVF